MTSKVCPVCNTFSSSSNTTLNAHIDQCLSGESKIKWTANSRVTEHRIKPRKTGLMVDIYETASYCTLEELDRRNGTNWALNLGFPAQNIETCTEEWKKTSPALNLEPPIRKVQST
ncbi:hapless 8 [Forsythia ovata]|uniref:Hapless 8 n=1 Tax=Forsythia ovata TaxID=205694 RepID=A0ABD1NXU9_9LAMI